MSVIASWDFAPDKDIVESLEALQKVHGKLKATAVVFAAQDGTTLYATRRGVKVNTNPREEPQEP